MSSVVRRFQVRDGEVKEVTAETPVVGKGSSIGICQAYGGDRPGASLAMGCHSREIGMMNKAIHDHGIVGVEYVPHRNKRGEIIGGKPVITNNSKKTGRRAWMKLYGELTGNGPLHDEESYD